MFDILCGELIYLRYYFTIQFRQIVFYYMLGITLGSAISVFTKIKIHSLFASMGNKRFGLLGVFPASLLGIASPLCMYGTIPLAASFSLLGIKDDWLASFMMSSLLLNPQLIIYSASLGPVVLTVRIVSCFICGVLAGICVRLFPSGESFFNFSDFTELTDSDTDPNRLGRLLKNIGRNIKATGGWFLLGIAISAAFQRYVPDEFVIRLFGGNKGLGVLMAASVGVPLYACGGATIPLLQQWLVSGMSMGGAAAFMITGPAVKITNLGAMKIVLGAKLFLLYILYSISFAIITGISINLLL